MASGKRYRIGFGMIDDRLGEFDLVFHGQLTSVDVLDHMASLGMSVGRVFPEGRVLAATVSEICVDCGAVTGRMKLSSDCRCCPEPKEKIND